MKIYSDYLIKSFPGNKVIIILFFYLFHCNVNYCQVPTFILNGNSMQDYLPHYTKKILKPFILPETDILSALKADNKKGFENNRYGIHVPVDLNQTAGAFENAGNTIIWRMSVYAHNAKSLRFLFKDMDLPIGAQMYIYNASATMFSGPVENEHVFNRTYSTDVISGNEVIIEVVIPKAHLKKFMVTISGIIYGYRNIDNLDTNNGSTREYDESLACEVDVNCDAGAIWGNQRDAVAMALDEEGGQGSGVLLNTTCQELEGFFLTAQHGVDGATGHINWTFRFNYDSHNPTDLNNCRGDEPLFWLTYSGAEVISQWDASGEGTDFALIQLNGSFIGVPSIAFAGWDRTDYTPSSGGVGIHHPQGDVKKISIDDDQLVIEGYAQTTGSHYFTTDWDLGVTEDGSSGSPLYDGFTQRVIGQLRGGIADCDEGLSGYGRFFNSWTGGGTSTTRLSDWLGTSTTTSLIRSPYIGTVTPGPLCTTNRSYVLQNLMSGRTSTWAVTPTNLFATTSGASTSGSGTTAVLRGATNASGLGTLTFTLTSELECNPIVLSYQIWVGKPGGTLELEDNNICLHEEGIATILWAAGNTYMGVYSTVWTYSGPIDDFNGGPVIAKYSGSTTGHGYINVTRTNACGSQYLSIPYQISDCERSSVIHTQVYPNPSSGSIFISLNKDEISAIEQVKEGKKGMIKIFNKTGQLVALETLDSDFIEMDISSIQPDFYILEVTLGESKSRTKIIIMN